MFKRLDQLLSCVPICFLIVQKSCTLYYQNNTLEGWRPGHLQRLCSSCDSLAGCLTIPCLSLHVLLLHVISIWWVYLSFIFMYTWFCMPFFFLFHMSLHSIYFAVSTCTIPGEPFRCWRKTFWLKSLSYYR